MRAVLSLKTFSSNSILKKKKKKEILIVQKAFPLFHLLVLYSLLSVGTDKLLDTPPDKQGSTDQEQLPILMWRISGTVKSSFLFSEQLIEEVFQTGIFQYPWEMFLFH